MAGAQAVGPDKPKISPRPSTANPGRLGLRVPSPPPAFLPLQHPRLVARPPTGPGWTHEVKLDGYRMQVAVRRGVATWFSRNGHDWSARMADFAAALADMPDCVFDGELCALMENGRSDFSALRSAMGRREAGRIEGDLRFFAFDCLRHGREDLRPRPLAERKEHLEALFFPGCEPRSPRLDYVDPLAGEGALLLEAACRLSLEGIVSKRLDAPYTGGVKRLDSWVKAKCRPSQEVVVGGWESDGSRFRSLLAGVWENGAFRYVGHINTGYPQSVVADLLPRLRAMEILVSPYASGDPPRKTSDIHWVRPELVANVEIAEWTASGKLRQSSFKGLRFDKAAREVVREGTGLQGTP